MMGFFAEVLMRVRGLTEDPAFITLIWLAIWFFAKATRRNVYTQKEKLFLVWLVGISGIFLYPATLGLSMWDPYRYGYTPEGMVLVFGLIALWAVKQAYWVTTVMLVTATVAFTLHWKTSTNYWDYLIDPMVVIYSWSVLLRLGYKKACSGRFLAAPGQAR